jgi:8-oxo-dGTP pyrophosphatase MutT (NUDIX family)
MKANVMSEIAALSYIEADNGRVLCVWNRRYQTWGLPGGKAEGDEHVLDTLVRELREETSLEVGAREFLMVERSAADNGRLVFVYRVRPLGKPRAVEPGTVFAWLTRDDMLAKSRWAGFYRKLFDVADEAPWS